MMSPLDGRTLSQTLDTCHIDVEKADLTSGRLEEETVDKPIVSLDTLRIIFSSILIVYALLNTLRIIFHRFTIYPIIDISLCIVLCAVMDKSSSRKYSHATTQRDEEDPSSSQFHKFITGGDANDGVRQIAEMKRELKAMDNEKFFTTLFMGVMFVKVSATVIFMFNVSVLGHKHEQYGSVSLGMTSFRSRSQRHVLITVYTLVFALQQTLLYMSYAMYVQLKQRTKSIIGQILTVMTTVESRGKEALLNTPAATTASTVISPNSEA